MNYDEYDPEYEAALQNTIAELRGRVRDAEVELEVLRRGRGIVDRLRYGDRVQLMRDYGEHSSAPKGAIGKITYVWPDGQVAVSFTNGAHAAYWPRDLSLVDA